MQTTVNEDREKYLGGSDIPVIMNLSPFKSRFDLLLEKAGFKNDDFEGNIYTEYGNELEPKIRDYFNSKSKKDLPPFVEGKHTRKASEGETIGVRIHTDGERVIKGKCEVLEIKTTSRVSDDIDDYKIYLVQLLFYMVMLNAELGYLAIYERPEDFNTDFDANRLRIFGIYIGDYLPLIEEIKRATERFIEDLEIVKENPFISEAELIPSEVSDIAADIVNFENQLSQMKEIEKRIKEDKKRLYEAMAAASVKTWRTPQGFKITLVEGTEDKVKFETRLDEETLKEEHPRIYKKYLREKAVTVKGKAGYIKIIAPKGREEG